MRGIIRIMYCDLLHKDNNAEWSMFGREIRWRYIDEDDTYWRHSVFNEILVPK